MSGLSLPTGGGIGAVLLVVIVLALFGSQLLGDGGGAAVSPGEGNPPAADDATAQFVDAVLDDIQITWESEFERFDRAYEPTEVVLFEGSTQTGCGVGSSSTGPFYCPADRTIYLDLGFFDELERRFGAPGDFAAAYVIAHEVGHHVQTLLGTEREVRRGADANPGRANELSIRLELQADCYAGVWGRAAKAEGILEPGDLEEGLRAAAAVGDDRIQETTGGRIDPESWTHGSSEQRRTWFRTGFQVGAADACDTFDARI